ncbi:MAG: beta galactosidase jelly roll domain-containing protein [Tannerellaceae bacterium]|nr:beta galactosidase jelly roll domain-containing protein [Tannerellaceae bacterium]
MKHTILFLILSGFLSHAKAQTVRQDFTLEKNWRFTKGDISGAESYTFNDSKWELVTIPHDWAIFGPFDRNNDLQEVAVTQNFETEASVKTGRTGGLPYVGTGWYRTSFDVDNFDKNRKEVSLLFDGAMSEAQVYVNGKKPASGRLAITLSIAISPGLLNEDGKNNILAVRLENKPQSSRWYPGAGALPECTCQSDGQDTCPGMGYLSDYSTCFYRNGICLFTDYHCKQW